jgi:hypothetical protein
LGASCALGLEGPARAEPAAVASVGMFGTEQGENRAALVDLEYRFDPWRFGFGPVLGLAATTDGGAYLRAGLARDFAFGDRWNANVSVACAGYERGHGKELGRGFEFRSAIDVSYHVRPSLRVGWALAHLSNGGISESNPGVETVTLTIAFIPRQILRQQRR